MSVLCEISIGYRHLHISCVWLCVRARVCVEARLNRRSPYASLAQAKGASVYEKDECGRTALMFAAHDGHKVVAEFLVVRGAMGCMFKRTAIRESMRSVHDGCGRYAASMRVCVDAH